MTPDSAVQGRRSRRVRVAAAPGVDAHPADHPLTAAAAEDAPDARGDVWSRPGAGGVVGGRPYAQSENDTRLVQDRPPHYS